MKKKITLEIECGEKSCASEPGKFCQYLHTRKFGSIDFCSIWYETDIKGQPCQIEEKDGWMLRRPECLEAERGELCQRGDSFSSDKGLCDGRGDVGAM